MSNPHILPEALWRENSGIDQLRAIIAGDAPGPSMATTLGFRLVQVDEGFARFEGGPDETMTNPFGSVHGGWAATILDSALGCAVHATLMPGETYATLEFKVNLTRAIKPGAGPFIADGHVITRGRRVATSEARLTGADGKVYAFGTSTLLINTAS